MKTFAIPSLAFHLLVIAPVFGDRVTEDSKFKGLLSEFTIMDNVSSSKPIIDIKRNANILQRRDASCDIIYKKVFGATTRKIYVDEIYGASQFCRNEFYQGDLKDWRNNDPVFGEKILPFFQNAIATDIATNAWFGDTSRVVSANDAHSTGVFDGVLKHIKTYIDAGVIPSSQTNAISTNLRTSPEDAYAELKKLYDSMPELMTANFTDSELVIMVDSNWKKGYERYLIEAGLDNGGYITDQQTGIKQLAFEGIKVVENPLFSSVIAQLKGSVGHLGVLTVDGNFVFATDKEYGEGEDGKTALEVFYDQKEMKRYFRAFLKAGTQIALPEFVCISMSAF